MGLGGDAESKTLAHLITESSMNSIVVIDTGKSKPLLLRLQTCRECAIASSGLVLELHRQAESPNSNRVTCFAQAFLLYVAEPSLLRYNVTYN